MAITITSKEQRDKAINALTTVPMNPAAKQATIQAIKDFDKGVDQTPYAPKKTWQVPGPINPQAPQPDLKMYSDKELEAAKSGVDVDFDLPERVGLGASFAANESELFDWYKRSLTQELGYEPEFRRSATHPDTVEFLNKDPKTGKSRWTMVKPSSTLSYAGAQTGLAIPELAGSVAGGLAGAPAGPLGVSALMALGGGAGAGASEYARQKIGQSAFGMNENVPNSAIATAARGKAADSAVLSAATDLGTLALRGFRYWFKGLQPVNKTVAEALLRDADEGAKLASEINKYAGKAGPVQFSIPQMAVKPTVDTSAGSVGGRPLTSFTPTVEGKEAMALQQQAMNHPGIGLPLRRYTDNQENALMDIYDNMATEVAPRQVPQGIDPSNPYQAGQPAVEAMRRYKLEGEQSQRSLLETAEENTRKYIEEAFPDAPPQQLAMETRRALVEGQMYWKENERLAWTAVRNRFLDQQGNFRELLVGVDDDLAKYLRQEMAANQYSFFKKGDVLGQSKLDPRRAMTDTDTVPWYLGLKSTKNMTPDAVNDPRTQLLGISALTDDIKTLRNKERAAAQWGITVSKVKEIEEQLVGFRDRSLEKLISQGDEGALRLKQDLDIAEKMSKLRADRFNQGIVQRVIKTRRDTWSTQDMQALGYMLSVKDAAAYDQFVRTVKESPGGLQKLRQTFLGAYMKEATTNGLPDAAKHDKFMANHGWALEKLFGTRELAEFSSMKGFADTIASYGKALDTYDKGFAQTWGTLFGDTRFSDLSPDEVVKKIWSGGMNGQDVRSFMTFAEAADRRFQTKTVNAYKAGVLAELRRTIAPQGKLNLSRMQNVIDQRRDVLEYMFGPDFYTNFYNLAQAVGMSEFRGASKLASGAEVKIVEMLGRATVAPPLTREGRLLTLGTFLRESNYKRNIAKVFTDPEALRTMANYSKRQLTYQQWVNVMSKAAAQAGDEPYE